MRSSSITSVPPKITSSASFIVTMVPFLMTIRSLIVSSSPTELCSPSDALPALRHRGRQIQPDRLRLQVRLERFPAELAAEPRMLAPTERDRHVEHPVRVDPHGPGL